MKLFSTQLYSSGKFLLFLVSNLLLWENVASQNSCTTSGGKCFLTLRDLFGRAVMVSQYISAKSAMMFFEFDREFGHGQGFLPRVLNTCNTTAVSVPENKEEAEQMHPEVLMKVIVSILEAWNQTLEQIVNELSGMKDAPAGLLSSAKDIDELYKGLLQGMKIIYNKVWATVDEDMDNPTQLEMENWHVANEDINLPALYNLLHCLRRDSNKISTFIKILKCRLCYSNDC